MAPSDSDKSASPRARSIWARQPSSRSAAEQSAVMARAEKFTPGAASPDGSRVNGGRRARPESSFQRDSCWPTHVWAPTLTSRHAVGHA
jgi:hypothetical protein